MEEIIRLLEEYKPNSPKEIRNIGIKLKKIGTGAFREVYKVEDHPLVIKFPYCSCEDDCNGECDPPYHSRVEYSLYRRIMRFKKYQALRGFMPRIYYFDRKTGVMATHYYKKMRCTEANEEMCDLISKFFVQTLDLHGDEEDIDICPPNVGLDDEGGVKIFDLGCVS